MSPLASRKRAQPPSAAVVHCGRVVDREDIEHAKTVVAWYPALSRHELARTLCEHWGWRTASGAYKVQACLGLLDKLEGQGELRLPARREEKRRMGVQRRPARMEDAPAAADVVGALRGVQPVCLEVVSDKATARLWEAYVERYHILGAKPPIGCFLRYFVTSSAGRLGCVLLAGAAKSIGVRDEWIGWTPERRIGNLPWVVNNTRFLLFPWVRVPHLASHVLGQLARRLRRDWDERWGYRPVLMETFVDPARYRGTCYRAAGWTLLGRTTGEGLRRRGRAYQTTPKLMFVRPLVGDFRKQLCSSQLVGCEEP